MQTKHWIFLLGGVVSLSLLLLLLQHLRPASDQRIAEIYQDGVLVQTVDLSAVSETTLIPIRQEGHENILCVEPGRIAMQSANCPDGLCVHQGFITDSHTPIVCLPNRVVVKITHTASSVDAVTQ